MKRLLFFCILCLFPCLCTAQGSVWTRYLEPNEHAFTMEVPRGWVVRGGVVRRTPIQSHPVLMLNSPGGATKIILGNTEAIIYNVPTQLSYRLGFHEGSPYAPNGDPMIMHRYATGQQFAIGYGKALFGRECQNVQVVATRDRSDSAKRPPGGIPQTITAGEAFFTCSKSNHQLDGYMYSLTTLTGDPSVSAIWDADTTYGFLTPHGNGTAAGYVLSHIIGSIQLNQQWIAQQRFAAGQSTANTAAQMERQLAQNSRVMQQSFADTKSAQASAQGEIERLMSGFDQYQTATGETKSVQYGAATNWWSNGRGQTMGTQGPLPPGMNWTPMTRVAP